MAGAPQSWRLRSAFDAVRAALHAAGQLTRPRGTDAFMASCPLHDDHTPSLSVAWRESTRGGRGGAVLLHCFSCNAGAGDIAAALGLRLSDLFDNPLPLTAQNTPLARHRPARGTPANPGPLPPRITIRRQPAHHRWRVVRVYTYTTTDGRPVQQVIRQECSCGERVHKRFQQRYRHGRRWVYRKPDGFRPGLYRAYAIQAAATCPDSWVWITEGEKDADTLTGLGQLATTNAQGAGNFPAAQLARFRGLNIAVVADRDLVGYQRAITLYEQLHPIAARVVVLLARLDADKADVTDHVNAGLWRVDEPFGGLIDVSPTDLQGLAVAAGARQAAHRFAIATAEAQAHQARQPGTPASARAAARWLTEAANQLRTLRQHHRDLQHHTTGQPSTIAAVAADTVAALRARAEDHYRRCPKPAHHTRISAIPTTARGLKAPA